MNINTQFTKELMGLTALSIFFKNRVNISRDTDLSEGKIYSTLNGIKNAGLTQTLLSDYVSTSLNCRRLL